MSTEKQLGVSIIGSADEPKIQIPKRTGEDFGWTIGTLHTISKKGNSIVITKSAHDGKALTGYHERAVLAFDESLIDKLQWLTGDVLLMTVTEDTITIKEPIGADFCLDSLIESWLFIRMANGQGVGEALTDLAQATDRKFQATALARWRAGGMPPPEAINIMVGEVLERVTQDDVIDDRNLQKIQRGIQLIAK